MPFCNHINHKLTFTKPKSKGFARVKAQLLEEVAPIDVELRQEAEVVRQVRENDADNDIHLHPSQPTTCASSPSLGQTTSKTSGAFFLNKYDERMRTPPPPLLPRANSSSISDDVNMESTQSAGSSLTPQHNGIQKTISHESGSSASQTFNTTTFEIPKKGKKRMRDDELDTMFFKRRAVSPSMSVQNSPVLPQSPGWWGTPRRDDRASIGTGIDNGAGTGTGRRIGMQKMNDTNDGLMNMTIE